MKLKLHNIFEEAVQTHTEKLKVSLSELRNERNYLQRKLIQKEIRKQQRIILGLTLRIS